MPVLGLLIVSFVFLGYRVYKREGVRMNDSPFNAPDNGANLVEDASMPYAQPDPSAQHSAEQQRQAKIMAIDGVEGVGNNLDAAGKPGLVVYVRDADAAKRVPPVIDGLTVEVQVTGPINALGK